MPKILYDKGIWYELDIWGQEWPHDWNYLAGYASPLPGNKILIFTQEVIAA
ncbi:MAG: hypothetical protein WDO19_28880 [Bacteroidota bacterium]